MQNNKDRDRKMSVAHWITPFLCCM